VTGRRRPLASLRNGEVTAAPYTDDPYDFFNSRKGTFKADKDGSSFPSLHFTGWFAVAKVYSEAYGDPRLPYALMTIGLASSFQNHRHWLSDMVAGGLVGTLIGSVVAQGAFEDGKASRLDVAPLDGGARLTWSRRF
jgi:membrane-associated phospholipid phosphatase